MAHTRCCETPPGASRDHSTCSRARSTAISSDRARAAGFPIWSPTLPTCQAPRRCSRRRTCAFARALRPRHQMRLRRRRRRQWPRLLVKTRPRPLRPRPLRPRPIPMRHTRATASSLFVPTPRPTSVQRVPTTRLRRSLPHALPSSRRRTLCCLGPLQQVRRECVPGPRCTTSCCLLSSSRPPRRYRGAARPLRRSDLLMDRRSDLLMDLNLPRSRCPQILVRARRRRLRQLSSRAFCSQLPLSSLSRRQRAAAAELWSTPCSERCSARWRERSGRSHGALLTMSNNILL